MTAAEETRVGTCTSCDREGMTLYDWGDTCVDWEACSDFKQQAALASVVGSTIERVETGHTVTSIHLSDGRVLKVKTCSCCGMDVDVESDNRW